MKNKTELQNIISKNKEILEQVAIMLQETRFSLDDEASSSDKVLASTISMELMEKQIVNIIYDFDNI